MENFNYFNKILIMDVYMEIIYQVFLSSLFIV